MTTVRGKTAIVTGGADGIGFHYCQQLLLNGAKAVAILDMPTSNGEESAKKLNEEIGEGRALFFPSDVTKFEEFEVIFKKAVAALNGLDILINNAAMLNDRMWEKMIQINFTALVKSTLLGYDYMGKHKGGKGGIIVNISSAVGLNHYPDLPVYSATRHASLGFTISLKNHYEKTGISVRVMCPGVTETPLITDAQDNFLSFVDAEALPNMLAIPRQPAEYVAKSMIQLIEKGDNGSVWVSQCSEPPIEVEIVKYQTVKKIG